MLSFFYYCSFLFCKKYLFWQELKILIKITLYLILPKSIFKRFNNSRIKDLTPFLKTNLLIPILEMS